MAESFEADALSEFRGEWFMFLLPIMVEFTREENLPSKI